MTRIYKGVAVTVEETLPNTPAHGKFKKGDIIVGVNGALLKGKNPLVVLGMAVRTPTWLLPGIVGHVLSRTTVSVLTVPAGS